MRFGPVDIAHAAGGILAHSIVAGGKRFKKGHVLSADDVAALQSAGLESVTLAVLEPDDIHEDKAAERLARAIAGPGVHVGRSATGRANLFAREPGVLLLDRARLRAFNFVDEGVTLATLPAFARTAPRQMLATVKIIPFAVPETVVRTAEDIASKGDAILRVAAFREKRIGLVQTEVSGTKPAILDKTEAVMTRRVEDLGCRLLPPRRCAHDEAAIAEAFHALVTDGADILVAIGASAIIDRKDVIPEAVVAAGGRVDHFGMPVDPSNLLLLGHIGDAKRGNVKVVGAPGSVRSPKRSGFDWVLERLCADVPVDRTDIMEMGEGGLLKEIQSRPLPRIVASPAVEGDPAATRATDRRIAALLLAAGQSRRMGARNKLTEEIEGRAMVTHAARIASEAPGGRLTIVTGHEADVVRRALDDFDATFVHNPDFEHGLSTSLKHGIAALPKDCEGALIFLGDMPRLKRESVDALIEAFDPENGAGICVPVYRGKRGNPVLFAAKFFPEILEIAGDTGAKHLIGAYEAEVREVPVDDPGILLDIDTPDRLAAEREGRTPRE